MLTLDWAGRTEVGKVRTRNEDAFFVEPGAGVAAVADGMGGRPGGDRASALAIETVRTVLRGEDRAGGPASFTVAIEEASRVVHAEAVENPELRGMGTTLTLFSVSAEEATWQAVHVGDCRLYCYLAGELEQLSRDHTWVRRKVEAGELAESRADDHPFRNILTRVVGVDAEVKVEELSGAFDPAETYLLCSDGLTAALDDERIESILGLAASAGEKVDRLVEASLEAGAPDNVTVVVVQGQKAAPAER